MHIVNQHRASSKVYSRHTNRNFCKPLGTALANGFEREQECVCTRNNVWNSLSADIRQATRYHVATLLQRVIDGDRGVPVDLRRTCCAEFMTEAWESASRHNHC